mmetsp:Transcript_86153/g.217084  ORF Transcript_86153/g.217084 Transcript_86153/m.217084 type:complete len:237 (-) Transcript_86153:665-1375(-)
MQSGSSMTGGSPAALHVPLAPVPLYGALHSTGQELLSSRPTQKETSNLHGLDTSGSEQVPTPSSCNNRSTCGLAHVASSSGGTNNRDSSRLLGGGSQPLAEHVTPQPRSKVHSTLAVPFQPSSHNQPPTLLTYPTGTGFASGQLVSSHCGKVTFNSVIGSAFPSGQIAKPAMPSNGGLQRIGQVLLAGLLPWQSDASISQPEMVSGTHGCNGTQPDSVGSATHCSEVRHVFSALPE